MKHLSIGFVAVLAVAAVGCKASGGECDKAITNSLAVSKADLTKMPGVDDKALAKMHDLGVQHCTADKWSDDAVKCMVDAKSEGEAQGCYGKMSAEQRDAMNKAMMETMTAAPPAPAAAGSGSGAP
jgi:hypothetical protein